MSSPIRLNKLLSQLGIASRRRADELISQGKVKLNGKVLDKLGIKVDPDKDTIEVEGNTLNAKTERKYLYFLLNKPEGYISTVSDTHDRRTIMQLLPKEKGLFPVGRLDKDTTGIIIITNDGDLAHRLMHPRYEIEKTYDIEIKGSIKRGDIQKLEKGVNIGDKELSRCKVLNAATVKDRTKVRLQLHEGRKRQIRRTFEAIGYKVTALDRMNYCGLRPDVKKGSYRKLSTDEIAMLKKKVGL